MEICEKFFKLPLLSAASQALVVLGGEGRIAYRYRLRFEGSLKG